MKTLARAEDVAELRGRLAALDGSETARFGQMTVAGMVCHVTDSFRLTLGEISAEPKAGPPIPLAVFKWLALRAPMRWRPGFRTVPEIEQGVGGSAPGAFAADRARLLAYFERFVAGGEPWPAHAYFGPLTTAEWMRWGYLHTEHHLRQFGR